MIYEEENEEKVRELKQLGYNPQWMQDGLIKE